MKNTTTSMTYGFEPRLRSVAPTSTTLQGRAASAAGAISGWSTSALVPTPVQGRIGTDVQVFGTKPQARHLIDPRLHRTSPL